MLTLIIAIKKLTSKTDCLKECYSSAGPQVKEVTLRVGGYRLALIPVVVQVEALTPVHKYSGWVKLFAQEISQVLPAQM